MGAVVVGFDGSECADAALRTAIDVAKAFDDDVHVIMSYEVNRLGGEVADYARGLREQAEEVLAAAREQAGNFEIHTEIAAERRPPDALMEAAERLDARVIVVGSRGESPLKGALVGSTPHKLLQVADRPVLVVPA